MQLQSLVRTSKSCNTLNIKNFSDSAKEYGSFENLRIKKPIRTNSVSKRENSPLIKDLKKITKIKKKVSNFSLLGFVDINKNLKTANLNKQRTGSARPASPYVKKDTKEMVANKAQILKPSWKF